MSESQMVNLLDLAASSLASSVTASLYIRDLAEPKISQKEPREKEDGSFVTNADFAAQAIILQGLRRTCHQVRIVSEESPEEVESVTSSYQLDFNYDNIFELAKQELYHRYRKEPGAAKTLPLSQGCDAASRLEELNVAAFKPFDNDRHIVDVSRVTVFVDPLDGTKAYVTGDYQVVSVLIAIMLDHQPCFGVICKPFGHPGITSILDQECSAVYGGDLLDGVHFAGGASILAGVAWGDTRSSTENLPRSIISSSRSTGIVQEVCHYLGSSGVLHPVPMHISGAGEKSLRLILRQENEGLWFFPKSGTSLWDVAASDALLRTLGGKITDKFGRPIDYNKSRAEAENVDGIIASFDSDLHAKCMQIFEEGTWESEG